MLLAWLLTLITARFISLKNENIANEFALGSQLGDYANEATYTRSNTISKLPDVVSAFFGGANKFLNRDLTDSDTRKGTRVEDKWGATEGLTYESDKNNQAAKQAFETTITYAIYKTIGLEVHKGYASMASIDDWNDKYQGKSM